MAEKVTRALFDLQAIGTRLSTTRFFSTEMSWWSDLDGDILGTVILDSTDQDFGWIMLMRDFSGRFRCVGIEVNFHSERIAAARLREAICSKTVEIGFDRNFRQGDEPNRVFDLLDTDGVSIDRLHKYFRILTETSSHLPAMRVIQSISPWFSTSDPHFKKEFQETQFDQRLWEIYLWAVLRNQGFDVEHCEAPDLIVSDPHHKMAIEATTVAPSMSGTLADHPEPKTSEDVKEFLKEYMPMKFGSPLKSKLSTSINPQSEAKYTQSDPAIPVCSQNDSEMSAFALGV